MAHWFGTTIISTDYVLLDILGQVTADDLQSPDAERAARIQALLLRKVSTVQGLAGISLYGADCVFRHAADQARVGFRSNQRFCRDQTIRIGPEMQIQYIPITKSANRKPALLVSRNVIDASGGLAFGTLAAITLEHAQGWIEQFKVAPSDVLAMVDTDSVLLARNPPLPRLIGSVAPLPQDLPILAGAQARSSGFVAISPVDGIERIYGISRIERVPLMMIVGFDKDGVLQEWRRRAWQLSLAYAVMFLLSFAVLQAYLVAVRQREQMRVLATTDALTGIANRRRLLEVGDEETNRARRFGRPMSVLMLDIDRFKAINDTFGHPTGDRAIQALTRVMTARLRNHDIPGRLGGEEFAIVLPETSADQARAVAERLRQAVAGCDQTLSDGGQVIRYTISLGLAVLHDTDTGFEGVLGRADEALYAAKTGGRNQVAVAD
jgi:diguanylate cyclase (GGDEF)-like protein